MKTVSTWRLILGALIITGGVVGACSSHDKHQETVPPPLGQSTAPGPADPNKPQPDSASVPRPEQPVPNDPTGPQTSTGSLDPQRVAQVDTTTPTAGPGTPFASDAGVAPPSARDAGARDGGTGGGTSRDGGIGTTGSDAGTRSLTPTTPGAPTPGQPGTSTTTPTAPTAPGGPTQTGPTRRPTNP